MLFQPCINSGTISNQRSLLIPLLVRPSSFLSYRFLLFTPFIKLCFIASGRVVYVPKIITSWVSENPYKTTLIKIITIIQNFKLNFPIRKIKNIKFHHRIVVTIFQLQISVEMMKFIIMLIVTLTCTQYLLYCHQSSDFMSCFEVDLRSGYVCV